MMRHLLLLLSTCVLAFAQAGPGSVITTAAGTDWLFPGDGRRAVDAPLGGTLGGLGVAIDTQGNYLIADGDNNMLLRVGADGILNVIAGNGIAGHSGDNGPATAAALGSVRAAALDRAGDYLVLTGLGRVRKITRSGVISTIAGNGDTGYNGDNQPAINASLNDPWDLAVDSAGAIYVADTFNHRIRKITPDGIIITVAGTGQPGDGGDNIPGTSAALNTPTGVAVDSSGNVYIADHQNRRIRRLSPSGNITSAVIDVLPTAVEIDPAGTLYFAEGSADSVFKVVSGNIVQVAGSGSPGFSGDGGAATRAQLDLPLSVAVDAASNLYIGDRNNNRIRKVTPDGVINTVAGNGQFRSSGDGGPATSATLHYPRGSASDAAGNLYISEPSRHRVRRISNGILTTYAGTGRAGYSGDGGPATAADLFFPTALAFDRESSDLLIVDQGNNRIRKIGPDGIIRTVAGDGRLGVGADNVPAVESSLNSPDSVAVSGRNIYIADTGNHRIRRVDANGQITTFAGTGERGRSDDNIPATRAALADPSGIAVDTQGNVYISDTGNNRIRKIDQSGTITTVVGAGTQGNSGDGGPAVNAELSAPSGLAFTPIGDLFFADTNNNRIRCFVISKNNIIVTVAGTGQPGYSGDGGLAPRAALRGPTSLAIDPSGNAFVTDSENHRIRQLRASPPGFRIEPGQLTFEGNAHAAAPPTQTVQLFAGVPNVPFTAEAQTDSGGDWLSVTPTVGAMNTTVEVTVNPERLDSGVFRGQVRFSAPLANPPILTIAVEFQVGPALPSQLATQPTSLIFSFTEGGGESSQTVNVTNSGSGSKDFIVTARATTGGNWLTASPASGSAVASTDGVAIQVQANPAGLKAGTYLGTIALGDANETQATVAVTMTINPVPQRMALSPVGLSFLGLQSGGAIPPQTFTIVNSGTGNLRWSARVTEISGGTQWLSLSAENGSATGSMTGSRVEARANPAGLAAGDYYGQIEVSSPEAVNSPQFISVFLHILEAGADAGPVVQPAGLVFRATQRVSPGSQEIQVSNLGSRPISFRASRAISGTQEWFVSLPTDATVTQDRPARIVVQPQTEGLSAGVYEGSLTLLFDDGTTRTVRILLVNSPPSSPSGLGVHSADGCTPTRLLPVLTSVGLQSTVLAGWPNPVVVDVLDDCGNPLVNGSVVSEFSNNDAPVLLTSSNDGKWSGIWQIREAGASSVTVKVKAAQPDMKIEGTAQVTSALRDFGDVSPVINGVVSAASFKTQPLAPGGFISIFGARLADQLAVSDKLPFDTELANASVSIAGRRMPLYFTSDGQINAIVPYGVATNTTLQLVAKRGSRIATPESVTVASAQPGVFTKDADGQGAIVDVQGRLVNAASPVKAGDAVLIFCTGLGSVNPPLAAGSAAPSSEPLARTTEPVSVTIGGRPASILFAGLAPGFAGLYQVNAIVPEGVAPGNRVMVVVKAGDQEAPPVTIAVQ